MEMSCVRLGSRSLRSPPLPPCGWGEGAASPGSDRGAHGSHWAAWHLSSRCNTGPASGGQHGVTGRSSLLALRTWARIRFPPASTGRVTMPECPPGPSLRVPLSEVGLLRCPYAGRLHLLARVAGDVDSVPPPDHATLTRELHSWPLSNIQKVMGGSNGLKIGGKIQKEHSITSCWVAVASSGHEEQEGPW